MPQDQWKRVEEIFHAALERSQPDRAAYLDAACAGDAQLRREVESLLGESGKSNELLEVPAGRISIDTKNLKGVMAAGTRLGPYEVVEAIGAGGMGQVYRARDTRLRRDVAVKVLLEGLSSLPGRKERFEREARAVSALNHPHICTLYDVGNHEGIDFLVMELVEGESLSTRIKRGALPLKAALKCAAEIADALDKAHQHGIIHRDLKPGNVMLTKRGAKLLDFGIAKLRSDSTDTFQDTVSHSTVSTADGAIMGTVDYMAPEVLKGKTADARSDIFALGAVLYEMLTGQRAFAGETYPQVMAAILEREPQSISQVQGMSANLERLIRKCLAKDPDDRWQSAHDLKDELHWLAESDKTAEKVETTSRRWTALIGWGVAVVAIAAAVFTMLSRNPSESSRFAFTVIPNEVLAYGGASEIALSPDGKHLAFLAAGDNGEKMLWLRNLDSPSESRPLPGTENAWYPFWSPDSTRIGFSAERKLKTIALDGASVQVRTDAPVFAQCDWGLSDVIVCGDFSSGGLFQLAAGGSRQTLTQLDKESGELAHLYPQFLPDGKHIIYYVNTSRKAERGVYLRSLEETGKGKKILTTGSRAVFASPGYLLEVEAERLVAHPFDLRELKVSGNAVSLRDATGVGSTARMYTSVSASGPILAYGAADHRRVEIAWYDRKTGLRRPLTVNLPSQYRCTQLRLSPDEQWVALEVLDLQASSYDIWLLELATARVTKFTTDAANERDPVFSKDGRRIAFTSDRNGTRDIYEKEVGGREDSPLMRSANDKYLEDWPASDLLVFRISEGFGGLFRLGAAEPERLLPASDYRRDEFNVSPNGEWIAFNTEESGNYEVKVASFPAFRNQTAVSAGGGSVARWRKNGEEIFYLTMSGELMATRIKHDSNDGALQVAAPEVLTQTRINVSGGRDQYAASGDGQRFLLLETVESQPVPPITVITNWHSLLKPD